jgi:glucosamine--fructose-6-phosphate aminotransferase (isomerizing)
MDYTLKEILETTKACKKVLGYIERNKEKISEFLKVDYSDILFAGCGSSYYLSQSAATTFSRYYKRSSSIPSSEVFIYPDTIFNKRKNLTCITSRSGETSESIIAAKHTKKRGSLLVITCNEESTLSKLADLKIISTDGKEKSIVMTKSFTSMLFGLINLAILSSNFGEEYLNNMLDAIDRSLKINTSNIINEIIDEQFTKFIFLGSGPFYGIANEGMLKIKEMAYNWSEAYSSLEFRHGPIAILDEKTLVTILLSNSGKNYEIKLIEDIKKLGGKTFVISKSKKGIENMGNYNYSIDSELGDYLITPAYLPILQLLAFYTAKNKGINPDKPQNLEYFVKLK